MEQIGYSLVTSAGAEVMHWGDAAGSITPFPSSFTLPSGAHVCGATPGQIGDYRMVPRMLAYGAPSVVFDGEAVIVTKAVTSAMVNAERDRRLRQFSFSARQFDFCDGRGSDINIAGAGTLALAAIIAGAQPNDLRWADPIADFTWVAADNTQTTMDAQTCLLFAQAAASWKARHIRAARVIKDMETIPADYADNARWPS